MLRRPGRPPPARVALMAGMLLAGCGSTAPAAHLSPAAAASMRSDLDRLAAFAAAGDPTGATRALDAFAAEVSRERAAGRLAAGDYAALESGVARTRARIAAEVTAPAATAVSTSPPTPTPAAAPATGNGNGNGNGKGKGLGRAKDKGGGNGSGGD